MVTPTILRKALSLIVPSLSLRLASCGKPAQSVSHDPFRREISHIYVMKHRDSDKDVGHRVRDEPNLDIDIGWRLKRLVSTILYHCHERQCFTTGIFTTDLSLLT